MWRALGIAGVAVCLGSFLLLFLVGLPGLVFGALFVAGFVGLLLANVNVRRITARDFEGLIRQPTWEAATRGEIRAAHRGDLVVLRAEGDLFGRPGSPYSVIIGLDDVAFVAVAQGPVLNRMQRLSLTHHDASRFEVLQDAKDCWLVEHHSGMRVRLLTGKTQVQRALEHVGLDGGDASSAEALRATLRAGGWLTPD